MIASNLIAPLQFLDLVCELLGLSVALLFKLLHFSLDPLIQQLKFFYVVLKLFQQSERTERLPIPYTDISHVFSSK